MDKLFIFSMDWHNPGRGNHSRQSLWSSRPQRSKHQKTENERHEVCAQGHRGLIESTRQGLKSHSLPFSPAYTQALTQFVLLRIHLEAVRSPFPLLPPGPSHQPASPGLQQHVPTWFLCFHFPLPLSTSTQLARGDSIGQILSYITLLKPIQWFPTWNEIQK